MRVPSIYLHGSLALRSDAARCWRDAIPQPETIVSQKNTAARQIVANLLIRARRARKNLHNAERDPNLRCRELVLTHLRALENEAYNSAEVSRRILYLGLEAR